MKKTLTALAIGAALTSSGAFAAPVACVNETNYTLGELAGLTEGCLQGDKLWSNFSFTTMPTNTQVVFSVVDVGGGVENHSISFNFPTPITAVTGGGSFSYRIEIYNEPSKYFSRISLGADISDPVTNLTYIGQANTGVNYTITNTGGAGGTYQQNTASNETAINVSQSIAVFTGTQLNSVTHTYRQTVSGIPEIDALAGTGALTLLGGALALAGERRRRKA